MKRQRQRDWRKSDNMNVDKLVFMSLIVNAFQILAALTVTLLALISGVQVLNAPMIKLTLTALSLIIIWGATVDIRDAFLTRKLGTHTDMLEDAFCDLETLNVEMRKQRHDFVNHLQVVYSLIELGDTQESMSYIERVYGDLKRVGQSLRTSVPAVNALLAAKLNDAESRGVRMQAVVRSAWDGMPVPGWEICRAIGNLIDNAFDALAGVNGGEVTLTLGEDLRAYTLSVENNGPEIPPALRERIFEERFSTKGRERGMGLAIVRDITRAHSGDIQLESNAERTRFTLTIPKPRPLTDA